MSVTKPAKLASQYSRNPITDKQEIYKIIETEPSQYKSIHKTLNYAIYRDTQLGSFISVIYYKQIEQYADGKLFTRPPVSTKELKKKFKFVTVSLPTKHEKEQGIVYKIVINSLNLMTITPYEYDYQKEYMQQNNSDYFKYFRYISFPEMRYLTKQIIKYLYDSSIQNTSLMLKSRYFRRNQVKLQRELDEKGEI